MPSQPSTHITLPLDIPNVQVLSTEQIGQGQIVITVQSCQETLSCGICRQEIACNNGHGQPIRLRHLPVFGQETYIIIRPRRAKCPTCLHTPSTTQQLTWYRQRSQHTNAYEYYLLKLLVGSTVADVSLKEQIGYDAILGVLERHVPTQVDWGQFNSIDTIGIDEVATKKGHKGYRAIVTARHDDGGVHVLGVLKDRKKRVSRRF